MIAGCAKQEPKQGKKPIHDTVTVALHPVDWPEFPCPRSANCTMGPIDSVAFGKRGIFAYHIGGNGKQGSWLNDFGYLLTEADIHRAVDPSEIK